MPMLLITIGESERASLRRSNVGVLLIGNTCNAFAKADITCSGISLSKFVGMNILSSVFLLRAFWGADPVREKNRVAAKA